MQDEQRAAAREIVARLVAMRKLCYIKNPDLIVATAQAAAELSDLSIQTLPRHVMLKTAFPDTLVDKHPHMVPAPNLRALFPTEVSWREMLTRMEPLPLREKSPARKSSGGRG